MNESIEKALSFSSPQTGDVLTAVLREGAQEMLTRMIRAEVDDWIADHAGLRDDRGHQQVVRNGYLPKRQVLSGLGPVEVTQPRVHDRRGPGEREKFSSRILPPYLRKAKSIDELIPWLYLKSEREPKRIVPARRGWIRKRFYRQLDGCEIRFDAARRGVRSGARESPRASMGTGASRSTARFWIAAVGV